MLLSAWIQSRLVSTPTTAKAHSTVHLYKSKSNPEKRLHSVRLRNERIIISSLNTPHQRNFLTITLLLP